MIVISSIVTRITVLLLMSIDYFFYYLRMIVSFVLKSPAKDVYNKESEKLTNDKKWIHGYLNINSLDTKEKIKIHYVCHEKSQNNKDNKPLMLMIHGFPEMWYSWRNQLEEFSKDYCAVAIDMRGFGLSDKPQREESYKIKYMVNDIKEVIGALGYSECILVSHDWGSIISYQFLYAHPNMVTKNVIMSVPHPASMQTAKNKPNLSQLKKSWYILFFQLPWLPEYILSKNNFEFIDKMYDKSIKTEKNKLSSVEVQGIKNSISNKQSLFAQLAYYRNLLPLVYSTVNYPKLNIPSLIFAGEKDHALEVKTVIGNLQNLISPLKICVVANCGHFVMQDNVEFVNNEINQFLLKEY